MSHSWTTTPEPQIASTSARWVTLVGNPNTGKSTIFNALTGLTQHVGNFPGVTVEKKFGFLREKDREVVLVDLPGCYSLAARSPDEMVANDVLLGRMPNCPKPEIAVVVADATNLERNLYLATQILEIGVPCIICLNMIDVAEKAGFRFDIEKLSRKLGVTIIPTAARTGRGLDQLRKLLLNPGDLPRPVPIIEYPDELKREAEVLHAEFAVTETGASSPASTALECRRMLLEAGGYAEHRWTERLGAVFQDALNAARGRLEAAGLDLTSLETRARYERIGELLVRYVQQDVEDPHAVSERIDTVLTHRVLGSLIFLALMAIVFQAIYTWSAPLMDAVDAFFGLASSAAAGLLPEGAFRSFVADGVITGVGAVVVFLPQILILFLFIAVLEDCGYLPRAAFLMDRLLSKGGLTGKAFIPLLSSFACAVPGIMATRVIERRRDRFITIMVAPLMSCSARLPVYVLMIGTFIPATHVSGGMLNLQGAVLFLMYCVGAAIAVPVALILRRTAFKGDDSGLLLMELPPYKWPSPRNVFTRIYLQGKAFLVRAGTIVFAVSVIVWILTYYPRPASIGQEYEAQRQQVYAAHGISAESGNIPEQASESLDEIGRLEAGTYVRQSYLGRMGQWIEPVVAPLGWDWKIGTAVIASFPAREVVIAVMGIVYDLGDDENEESVSLQERLRAEKHPDGRSVYSIPVGLSIMVFFALCAQCAATLAAIRRETNSWRWPVIVFSYMTVLAYVGAFITYRVSMLVIGA